MASRNVRSKRPLKEEHAPLRKRSKNDASLSSILHKPSPLGLTLKKSPSLLELAEMMFFQRNNFITNKKDDSLHFGSRSNKETQASIFTLDSVPCEAPSSSSAISLSDLFDDDIQHDLTEEMDSMNDCRKILKDVELIMLSDDQITIAYDDIEVIARANSFGNLLKWDAAKVLNSSDRGPEEIIELDDDLKSNEGNKIEMDIKAAAEEEDSRDGNPTSGMSRNNSFEDVLLHLSPIITLPRLPSLTLIASFS